MFEVMTDERYWTFDDNDLLKSVICLIDEKEIDMPVVWDKTGAYVEYNGQHKYVLVNN